MAVFWILATLMTLAALAFVLVPLLRGRLPSGPSSVEANLEALRGQRREIEADVANGTLPADAREEALAELVGRAQADLSAAVAPSPAAQKKPWITASALALALPALALGVYPASGPPAATDARVTAVAPASRFTEQQIVDMVDN